MISHLNTYSNTSSVHTLSEKDVESLTCCCRKCYEQLYPRWLKVVQGSVSQVIGQYYQLPPERRSCLRILELIGRHWTKEINMFESKSHYYETMLKVTDHLMRFLSMDRDLEHPIFLFEKMDTWIEEIQVQIQLNIHVVHLSPTSFKIKKYLVYNHSLYLETLKHMVALFSYKTLNGLPGKVEIINLLDGKSIEFDIDQAQIQQSLDYVGLAKNLLQDQSLSISIVH